MQSITSSGTSAEFKAVMLDDDVMLSSMNGIIDTVMDSCLSMLSVTSLQPF